MSEQTLHPPAKAGSLEKERMDGLLAMLPQHSSILEIGARHGQITSLLAKRYENVTALDLTKPAWELESVTTVQGDIQKLDFLDNSFDCTLCSEVLEHVPDVRSAARELVRVSRHEILVGVPYRQDTRLGRMTCNHCGQQNPPYGHLNRFDEAFLQELFQGATPVKTHFLATTRERTNALSAWLLNLARNPYGTYDQEEPCVHCGKSMQRPQNLSLVERLLTAAATRLNYLQQAWNQPQPLWIHVLFRKDR